MCLPELQSRGRAGQMLLCRGCVRYKPSTAACTRDPDAALDHDDEPDGTPRLIHQLFVQDVLHVVEPPVEIASRFMADDPGALGVLARHAPPRMRAEQYMRQVPDRAVGRQ